MTWDMLRQHSIRVFVTSWCPDCHRLTRILDRQKISYATVDIDQDAAAADQLRQATGKTAIPFVQVDRATLVRGWHDDAPGHFDEGVFLREVEAALGSR